MKIAKTQSLNTLAKNPKLGEAQKSDDEDPPEQMVTNQEARKCISCLKRYFFANRQ